MKFLETHTIIMAREARTLGVNPMMLSRLAADGTLQKVEHGIYARQVDWLTDPLKKYIVPCTHYSEAVICGVSALTYHDLTDEEERQIWVALPAPKVIHNPRYRVIRPMGPAYSLGIEKHMFGGREVRIYDIEKSVVDAFKYHTEEVALKALKRYLKMKDKNIQKLCDYGRQLRKPIDEIVTALQADE